MNKYSPYWILNPLKNDIDIENYGDWKFYTSKQVIDGESPLKDLGDKFYQILHSHTSLYEHCLWIFNKSEFDIENINRLARVLKSVSETFCTSLLSHTGIIITHENGNITKQPANPTRNKSIRGENLTNEKLKRVINITESIYKKQLIEYLAIFEYLSEIKKSSTFISELALWSFIEQHWSGESTRKLDESLGNLRFAVYDKNRRNPDYIIFRNNLTELTESLSGKKNNLTELRNSLAHGTFFKQQNQWNENQWDLFFKVHNFLFEMTLLGLEKEIN